MIPPSFQSFPAPHRVSSTMIEMHSIIWQTPTQALRLRCSEFGSVLTEFEGKSEIRDYHGSDEFLLDMAKAWFQRNQ